MSKKKEMKSVTFKRLLPEIYKKIIIEHATHMEVSEWLLEEHGLDLLGQKKDAKPFSNYLSVYGAIKTAKKSYADNIDNREDIAQNWYERFTSPDQTKTTKPVNTADVADNAKPQDVKSTNDDIAKPEPAHTGKSQRVSEKLGVVKRTQVSKEDLLKDFNPKL